MFDVRAVGGRIAEGRKKKDMTQSELADAMGISVQAVSNWERGNSMPDISKLADLCSILDTTVDELLGKKNAVVDQLAQGGDVVLDGVDPAEVKEAAEIAKPSTIKRIMKENGTKNVGIIYEFLPFLSSDFVAELARKEYDAGNTVVTFLPFMHKDDVDALMMRAVADDRDYFYFLPFVSQEKVGELANLFLKQGKSLKPLLCFMFEDDVDDYMLSAANMEQDVKYFLPFASEDRTMEVARLYLKEGKNIGEFLPYLCEDDVARLLEEYTGGDS